MNVSFLHNDPYNSDIVNSSDGRPLYQVQTPFKLGSRVTHVRRIEQGGMQQVVAEVHWHHFSSTMVTFCGRGPESTMPLDDFLRKEGVFSTSREFTGVDGKPYKWSAGLEKFTLTDKQANAVVAESHRHKFGVFGDARKLNIDIHPQGMHNLDVIIVTFIIMEIKRRNSATTAVAVTTANS
ncbi:hypothetical protein K439DRAFT_1628166 [Ramaria rubella]|nr:hypothetical protein K439DRAFT_1628166 [Ramaria rubella]